MLNTKNQSSIVPYGAYGLPYASVESNEEYKYPQGFSGSFWQQIVAGLVINGVGRLFAGNSSGGEKVTGISKDFVWLVMGLSEGQIEGIVDFLGNTSDTLNPDNPYRPLQGVRIDKTPVQNPDGGFNFREENDDGSLKTNSAIDFAYARGDIFENLALSDNKNIIAIAVDSNSQEIQYEQTNITETINLNITSAVRILEHDEYYLIPDIVDLQFQITQQPVDFNINNLVGLGFELTFFKINGYYDDNFGGTVYRRDASDDLGYEFSAPVTVDAIVNSNTLTIRGLSQYGIMDIDPQSVTLTRTVPIPTAGYFRDVLLSGVVDSLKVKISLVLQKSDKQGNPLKETMRFTISLQTRLTQGSGFSAETIIKEENIKARYPTETFFDYVIPVNPAAYQARVIIRRLSPPQPQQDGGPGGRKLTLVSVTSQTSDRIAYLNTAIAYMQFPAKVLQSAGQIWINLAGIKVKIPSGSVINYPGDRGLSLPSTWDGTFYIPDRACADPTWLIWHLLTEERYNIGIEERYIDKYKLFEISKYNNELIPNGIGGTERRHLFNGVIGAGGATNVIEMIRSICASISVKPYWNGSMLSFWQDRKEPLGILPRILTNADVEEGKFTYTSQEYQNTTTVAKVTYQSPQDDWENNEEIVEDTKYIARYGYHTEEFALLGETRRSAAIRAGRRVIADSLPTNMQVTMIVRPHGLFFNPGDVVQIADSSKLKIRHGGLIKSVQLNSIVIPDYPVNLLSDPSTAKLILLLPDGSRVERNFSCVLTNNACSAFQLTQSLPTTPNIGATWLIVDQQIPVQKYRIISVEPEGDSQMMFKVTGITYDENKYAYIEQGIAIPSLAPVPKLPAFMTPIDGGTVQNPKTRLELISIGSPVSPSQFNSSLGDNSILKNSITRSQATLYSLVAHWSPWEPPPGSNGNYFSHYIVEYRQHPQAEWSGQQTTTEPTAKWSNLGFSPLYSARVAAVSINNKISPFVVFNANVNDRMRDNVSLASQQLTTIENSLFNSQDGLVAKTDSLENVVYGAPSASSINSQESIIIQVILALLGRAATVSDIVQLLGFTTGFDDTLFWYQQRQIYYNVGNAIANPQNTNYSQEFSSRYSNKNISEILELIYRAAYNRSPDPIGLNYWTNYYNVTLGGQISSIGSLVVDIIFAGSGNADGVTFRSKVSSLGLGVYRPLIVVKLFIAIRNAYPTRSQVGGFVTASPFTYSSVANLIFNESNQFVGESTAGIITKIYNSCFDRNPEEDGLNYWSFRLQAINSVPNLIVEIINAASGNTDGQVLNNKAFNALNRIGFINREGGVIQRLELIEYYLLGKYDQGFETETNPQGLRDGEQGAIAALFGTTLGSQGKRLPKDPNTVLFSNPNVGDISIGEIANDYGGLVPTVYGTFAGLTSGFTSGIMSTLFGTVANNVYGSVPRSPSTGNIAITYGGIVGAIYAGIFDTTKANTGILARLDSIDARLDSIDLKLIDLELMITETIAALELQVEALNAVIEDKNQQLSNLQAQASSLQNSLSSTQASLEAALQTIQELEQQLNDSSQS